MCAPCRGRRCRCSSRHSPGRCTDRIGGRPLLLGGLVLNAAGLAWMALVLTTHTAYAALIGPFVLSGIGMALFFVPIATVALGVVPAAMQGIASGTNNALRELGGGYSASRCCRRSSPPAADTTRRRRSSTGRDPPCGWA
nr:MFS transporter [Candidatus Frankia alpina]